MSSPEHVECERVEERSSKLHNGMLLLLALAYHIYTHMIMFDRQTIIQRLMTSRGTGAGRGTFITMIIRCDRL